MLKKIFLFITATVGLWLLLTVGILVVHEFLDAGIDENNKRPIYFVITYFSEPVFYMIIACIFIAAFCIYRVVDDFETKADKPDDDILDNF